MLEIKPRKKEIEGDSNGVKPEPLRSRTPTKISINEVEEIAAMEIY